MNKRSPGGKRPTVSPTKPQAATANAASAPKATTTATTVAYAGQDDQAPVSSVDATWGNLHPARIWPD